MTAKLPRARLVLGGAGELERAREMARSLGFEDALETPGWVVGEEKELLLKRAWVFTLPSHWEAMPMAVLEAMAAGLPVVATRVGGVPAAVADGESGILVEPRDPERLAEALVRLLRDSALRKAMGAAGRVRALEQFSADRVVPAIEAVWASLLRMDYGAPPNAPSRGQVRHPS